MAFPNWIKRLNGWLERVAEKNKPRVERVLGRLPNGPFTFDGDGALTRPGRR